jgi:uncharacterized protein YkwD
MCRGKNCRGFQVIIKREPPKPVVTDRSFSDRFSKELCEEINKERAAKKLPALKCDP